MKAVKFTQFGTDIDTISGNSNPIELGKHNFDIGGVIPLHITAVVATLTGSFEGVIAIDDADHADGSAKWEDIDGGDLTLFSSGTSGKCTAMFAPYTHIRIRVDSGTCEARAMH